VVHLDRGTNGALAADVNNDGWDDLYEANQELSILQDPPKNFLYLANGDGTFTEVAAQAGCEGGTENRCVTAVDVDGDGWTDLFNAQTHTKPGQYPNQLYRNLGTTDGFTPAFQEILDPVLSLPDDATYGASWADFDQDGDADVLLCNETLVEATGTGDEVLARNDGTGAFTAVSNPGFNDVILNGLASWADFDDDGDLDVYITQRFPKSTPVADTGQLYRSQYPSPTFINVTADVGLGTGPQGTQEFTATWFDHDNDGDLDLWVTTGRQLYGNMLYENQLVESGTATFVLLMESAGIWDVQQQIGAAVVDLEGDGFLDVMTNSEQSGLPWLGPFLYRNNATAAQNHWLRLRLEGSVTARTPVGAMVEIDHPSGITPSRFVNDGFNTFSGNESTIHFGLASATQSDVRIAWPSGVRQTLEAVPADGPAIPVPEEGLRTVGTPVPGAVVQLDVAGVAGDAWLLFFGFASGPPTTIPPFGGSLQLAPPVFLIGSGTMPAARVISIPLPLPDSPSLPGTTMYFQSLQGAFPPLANVRWWDPLALTVQ